jgi:hypothetical protein
MNTVFDFIDVLNKKIQEHLALGNRNPSIVAISRCLYRRLMEMKSTETAIGNLVIGSSPVSEIRVICGTLQLVIDETLSETSIKIA